MELLVNMGNVLVCGIDADTETPGNRIGGNAFEQQGKYLLLPLCQNPGLIRKGSVLRGSGHVVRTFDKKILMKVVKLDSQIVESLQLCKGVIGLTHSW